MVGYSKQQPMDNKISEADWYTIAFLTTAGALLAVTTVILACLLTLAYFQPTTITL